MRYRRIAMVVVAAALVGACSASASPGVTPSGGGGGGGSVAAAAANVKDWCALLPADQIAKFAPGNSGVTKGVYPHECGATNGTAALEFQYTTGFTTFVVPANGEAIDGLADGAYIDRPTADEVELWVRLADDSDYGLLIDLAGHDGKDHKADAVAMAQAILARLQ
jgi:hypothetical protein